LKPCKKAPYPTVKSNKEAEPQRFSKEMLETYALAISHIIIDRKDGS